MTFEEMSLSAEVRNFKRFEFRHCLGQGVEELETVRGVFNKLHPSSPACSSQADLVLACILNTPNPAQSFVLCLDPLILKVHSQVAVAFRAKLSPA